MINILTAVQAAMGVDAFLGFMPPTPDNVIALFEYTSTPPEHTFGATDFIYSVQLRVRDRTPEVAYATAESLAANLNRYKDDHIVILQTSPVLDIGYDNANPRRQEYTVNFNVRRN